MKTNPNNLPESGWSVKSDGSDRVPNLVPREYMPKIGEYIGINERGTVQVDTEPFGQLLTLSEFERLSKPEINLITKGKCPKCGNGLRLVNQNELACDSCYIYKLRGTWYRVSCDEYHKHTLSCMIPIDEMNKKNPEPVKSETVEALKEILDYIDSFHGSGHEYWWINGKIKDKVYSMLKKLSTPTPEPEKL